VIDIPKTLRDGYRRFLDGRYESERALYAELATGQRPRLAILACADSRVDPAMIFDARPGEIFVIRNVANLVPDVEMDGGLHGTSAGLEFAVRHLEVDDIVVMGHGACGGIKACIGHDCEGTSAGHFIDHWVELASGALAEVRRAEPYLAGDALQRAVELQSVRASLARMRAFPFVAEAVAARRLRLHGAWFSIAEGRMLWLDQQTRGFCPVTTGALANGAAGT